MHSAGVNIHHLYLLRESRVDEHYRRVQSRQSRRLLPFEDKAWIEGKYSQLPNTIRKKDTSRDKYMGVLGLPVEWSQRNHRVAVEEPEKFATGRLREYDDRLIFARGAAYDDSLHCTYKRKKGRNTIVE
jgi:hypothetical protein